MRTEKLVGRIVAAAAAFVVAAVLALAWAVPGDPDDSFSGDGFYTVDLPGGQDEQVNAIAIQANGRIVLGGQTGPGGAHDFALTRLLASGTEDDSFSGDGVNTFDFRGVGGTIASWTWPSSPTGSSSR